MAHQPVQRSAQGLLRRPPQPAPNGCLSRLRGSRAVLHRGPDRGRGPRTVASGCEQTTHPGQLHRLGDAFGNGGRFQACILLHVPGHDGDVLLDCGASSLVALKQQHHDPNQIGLVLLSHLHGDHFGGVPFLVLDGQFAHRTRPLHVAGPAGVRERVQAAMEVLFPGSTGVQRRFALHFHELADRQPRQFEPAGLVVVPYEVVHASGAPALALRVAWQGHTIDYTGDTEWTEALVEVAQGADLGGCPALTDRAGGSVRLPA